jgi:hypothetical protein
LCQWLHLSVRSVFRPSLRLNSRNVPFMGSFGPPITTLRTRRSDFSLPLHGAASLCRRYLGRRQADRDRHPEFRFGYGADRNDSQREPSSHVPALAHGTKSRARRV